MALVGAELAGKAVEWSCVLSFSLRTLPWFFRRRVNATFNPQFERTAKVTIHLWGTVRVFESEFTTGEYSVFPPLQATELTDSVLSGSSRSPSGLHINRRKTASQCWSRLSRLCCSRRGSPVSRRPLREKLHSVSQLFRPGSPTCGFVKRTLTDRQGH
jgi:hypothetical protein